MKSIIEINDSRVFDLDDEALGATIRPILQRIVDEKELKYKKHIMELARELFIKKELNIEDSFKLAKRFLEYSDKQLDSLVHSSIDKTLPS